jgi:predicted RNA-binding Zn-ribbon protein involved in translation (DUF1610 family)
MKTDLARSIKRNILLILFLSILVLMLNSFLPIIALQDSNESNYFNIENMQHSQNAEIQKLYYDLNLVNIIIWALIICIFIAFFGVILDISEECQITSYLFLIVGCGSIIFSSLLCYLYLNFIFKVIASQEISLTNIAQHFRYSYIILIILIIIGLISILYNITTLPYVHKSFKSCKENKKIKTKVENQKKTFQKNYQQKKTFENKEQINMDKFKNKKDGIENWLSSEIDRLESTETEKIEKQDVLKESKIDELQEEIKDEKSITDEKNVDFVEEKKSPFSEEYIDNEPKQKKDTNSDVKLSESFEKALISAIDKKKNINEEQKTDKDKTQTSKDKKTEAKKDPLKETQDSKIKKQLDKDNTQKEKNIKKYNVKCPACNFIFTTIKNEEGATKIKCPRCGKEGVIK